MYDKELLASISRLLTGHQQTIAVAESVTSGQLQNAFSLAPDTALYFQGGITAYNIGQKYRHLHIDPVTSITCNCISEEIVGIMAINVGRLFSCDWGIGITGYASPMPEVGAVDLFAYYSISCKEEIKKQGIITAGEGEIIEVQQYYVQKVLEELNAILKTMFAI